MVRALGGHVIDIRRVDFAGVLLDNLPEGQWRQLRPGEVRALRARVAGAKRAKEGSKRSTRDGSKRARAGEKKGGEG